MLGIPSAVSLKQKAMKITIGQEMSIIAQVSLL